MSLDRLREEHQQSRIGLEWLRVVENVCRDTVIPYPPRIYGQVEDWEDGIDDLVQDVVINSLLEDRQADYLMAEAATEADFRRLLKRQVKHVLAQRRTKTVIDRLLQRSRSLLAQNPKFGTSSDARHVTWHLVDSPGETRSPTPKELRQAAWAAQFVPRIPSHGRERAPKVYTDKSLSVLLEIVAQRLQVPFDQRDLDRIFQELLTDYLPRSLDSGVRQGLTSERPEEEHEVTEAVERLAARLEADQAFIIAAKLSGVSDADLAKRLRVSRPTAAKRKDAAQAVVREVLEEVDSDLHDKALDGLALRLASAAGTDLGGRS